jgi:hypothetical protein
MRTLFKRIHDNQLSLFLQLFMIGTLAIGGVLFPFHETKAQGAVVATGAPILTQEDATARAKQLNLIPDGAEITGVKETKGTKDTKNSWTVTSVGPERNDEGKQIRYTEAKLLAADGSLMSFNDYRGEQSNALLFDEKAEKVSYEHALSIAEAFIKQQNWQIDSSWLLNSHPETAYDTRFNDRTRHEFKFNRTENGIPIDQQLFYIAIDRVTGEVALYQIGWNKLEFVPSSPIISMKTAGNIFFNSIQPTLFISNVAGTPNLVYALDPYYTLNAVNGKYAEIFNMPPPKIDKALVPKISAERAKKSLLSMYDIELRYINYSNEPVGLYYQLVVKPSVPVFYFGQAPMLDAKSGIWRDYIGNPVTQTVPAASDWLNEILYSPAHIKYKAAIALNGKVLPLNDEPIITNGSTLVPFRGLLENMDAKLTWDPVSKKVTAKTDNITIELTINSKTAYVNGKAYQLLVPAQIVKSRTYIPARFTAQALGATVTWETTSRLVLINMAGDTPLVETEHSLMLLRAEAQQNWDAKHLK